MKINTLSVMGCENVKSLGELEVRPPAETIDVLNKMLYYSEFSNYERLSIDRLVDLCTVGPTESWKKLFIAVSEALNHTLINYRENSDVAMFGVDGAELSDPLVAISTHEPSGETNKPTKTADNTDHVSRTKVRDSIVTSLKSIYTYIGEAYDTDVLYGSQPVWRLLEAWVFDTEDCLYDLDYGSFGLIFLFIGARWLESTVRERDFLKKLHQYAVSRFVYLLCVELYGSVVHGSATYKILSEEALTQFESLKGSLLHGSISDEDESVIRFIEGSCLNPCIKHTLLDKRLGEVRVSLVGEDSSSPPSDDSNNVQPPPLPHRDDVVITTEGTVITTTITESQNNATTGNDPSAPPMTDGLDLNDDTQHLAEVSDKNVTDRSEPISNGMAPAPGDLSATSDPIAPETNANVLNDAYTLNNMMRRIGNIETSIDKTVMRFARTLLDAAKGERVVLFEGFEEIRDIKQLGVLMVVEPNIFDHSALNQYISKSEQDSSEYIDSILKMYHTTLEDVRSCFKTLCVDHSIKEVKRANVIVEGKHTTYCGFMKRMCLMDKKLFNFMETIEEIFTCAIRIGHTNSDPYNFISKKEPDVLKHISDYLGDKQPHMIQEKNRKDALIAIAWIRHCMGSQQGLSEKGVNGVIRPLLSETILDAELYEFNSTLMQFGKDGDCACSGWYFKLTPPKKMSTTSRSEKQSESHRQTNSIHGSHLSHNVVRDVVQGVEDIKSVDYRLFNHRELEMATICNRNSITICLLNYIGQLSWLYNKGLIEHVTKEITPESKIVIYDGRIVERVDTKKLYRVELIAVKQGSSEKLQYDDVHVTIVWVQDRGRWRFSSRREKIDTIINANIYTFVDTINC
jgi:hypothetical protein